jgi:Tfp pilus assembly protein PilF
MFREPPRDSSGTLRRRCGRPRGLWPLLALAPLALLIGCARTLRGPANASLSGGDAVDSETLRREIAEARGALAASPQEPGPRYRLAELYAAADSVERCEAHLRAALELDPTHAPALSLYSKLLYDAGRHAEAIDRLERARAATLSAGAEFAEELDVALAVHCDAAGEIERADDVVGTLLKNGVDWRRSGSAVVYLKLRADDFLSARDPAVRALVADPASAANHNNYGITLLQAGDPLAAREAFLRASELDPALPGPYYNLAILEKYYLMRDDAAAAWFDRYRSLADTDPDGLAADFSAEKTVKPPAGAAPEVAPASTLGRSE